MPFASTDRLAAAALYRTSAGILHSGLFYKWGSEVRVLHLAWDNDLQNHWPSEPQRLWAAPEFEPEKLLMLRGRCDKIWRNYLKATEAAKDAAETQPKAAKINPLPYRYRFSLSEFTDRGLRLGPNADGLTCATFIITVFRSIGLILVDEDGWPARTAEDLAFLDTIPKTKTTLPILPLLKEELASGAIRIRPEEVLGACECQTPAGFADCVEKSKRIAALLPPVTAPPEEFPPTPPPAEQSRTKAGRKTSRAERRRR